MLLFLHIFSGLCVWVQHIYHPRNQAECFELCCSYVSVLWLDPPDANKFNSIKTNEVYAACARKRSPLWLWWLSRKYFQAAKRRNKVAPKVLLARRSLLLFDSLVYAVFPLLAAASNKYCCWNKSRYVYIHSGVYAGGTLINKHAGEGCVCRGNTCSLAICPHLYVWAVLLIKNRALPTCTNGQKGSSAGWAYLCDFNWAISPSPPPSFTVCNGKQLLGGENRLVFGFCLVLFKGW